MRTSTKSAVRLAGITLSAAAAFGFMPVGTATAASAPFSASTQETSLLAGAPCIVTGYSSHALDEMAADHIGTETVENIVYNTCSRARKQSDGTYKYNAGGKIVVICNAQGRVVTVWRR
ncbi:DUF4258 domain-containing protein [Sphaerisporangium fuscum]|uniref:DUF4258 domain-containing protein n=1 Tax=Sphaerisporangium fuscum TaxID=2835868 RepID=UPI001BDD0685|nr:DUF4258 domain-containing protein [Sphaerisporangium fuscum]